MNCLVQILQLGMWEFAVQGVQLLLSRDHDTINCLQKVKPRLKTEVMFERTGGVNKMKHVDLCM